MNEGLCNLGINDAMRISRRSFNYEVSTFSFVFVDMNCFPLEIKQRYREILCLCRNVDETEEVF